MNTDWLDYLESLGATVADGQVLSYPSGDVDAAGLIVDLGHLGSVHVSGADAAEFLQGQFTNDVRLSTSTQAQLSAWCTPKGRVQMLFWMFERDGGYQLLMPTKLATGLVNRLKMFVLRAKVEITCAPADRVRIGVSGTDAIGRLEDLLGELPRGKGAVAQPEPDVCVLQTLGPPERYELLTSTPVARRIWPELQSAGTVVDSHRWASMDIEAGMPLVTADAVDEYLPQMLNLMALDGINLDKGCYVGQEIVARAHYRGTVKRRLYAARALSAEAPATGAEILQGDNEDARVIGKVLASEVTSKGECALLAVMNVGEAERGHLHLTDSAEISLGSLPYTVETS